MDKKYFYLGSFNEKNDKVVFIDRVDICDVRKLALLAITLEPKTELVGAACYVNALEEYFMLNPAVDLKEVYEKMKKDSSGYKFLCLEVVISFCEDCFRKHNYDKKTLEETMDAYKCNMAEYQAQLESNNKFFENDYGKEHIYYGKPKIK